MRSRLRARACVALLVSATAVAGCGKSTGLTPGATSSTAGKVVTATRLAASMKEVLVTKYKAPQPVSVTCGGRTIRPGGVVNCDAISSAGQGYRVQVNPPCWTATFDGKIIEGPGFLPPGQRPKGPIASGPDNLPNKFSGCVK